MKIAIPTHRRSDVINKLTLSLLQGFDKQDIYIFVSDSKDMPLYQKECAGYNLILCNTDNATDKFNYIQEYFDDGHYIFVIEDDIKKIQSLVTSDVKKLFTFMESYCQNKKIQSFGIYPSSNKFFMSKTIDVGLTYIVANLFGFKANRDKRLLCSLRSKTDYERSVKYYKHLGNIARFNFVSCLTNNYTNKGGMQEIADRAAIEREASLMLCKLYPEVYSINASRKSKYTEVKMVKNVVKEKL
jgi:hypothetical protein